MSKSREVNITCPICNETNKFTIWDSINTMLDPELKEKAKDGSIFVFECPSCREKTQINYPCLYHQMEDEIMIYYATNDEDEKEIVDFWTNPNELFEMKKESRYLHRIVRSLNELREKIAIFDEKLDDRIIEIYKVIALSSLPEDLLKESVIEQLYYKDKDKHYFVVFKDGEYFGDLELEKNVYDKIQKDFGHLMNDIRDSEYIINRQWAFAFLKEAEK